MLSTALQVFQFVATIYDTITNFLWTSEPSLYPVVAALISITLSLVFFCKFYQNQTKSGEHPAIKLFQGSSNFQISNTDINVIGGDATIVRFDYGQFTESQRNMICDYIGNLTVLPDINNNLKKHVLTQSIISLPRAEAVFNDYQAKKKSGPCFEGTRVALLREMADWATGTSKSRMYVLSGLAGIGKSTVAYTIASRAADLNLLGASFFFSRDEADRNNAKKLFTTIAYQLCMYHEAFAKAIADVLPTERGSAATTKDPQEQLKVLILDPLRSIVQSSARPILIVVDALDECDEDDEHAVVNGLSQLVRLLPSFRVILTTRPQPLANYLIGSHDGHKIFHLQDIEDKVVDNDVRLYLSYSLSLAQVKARLLDSNGKWCASEGDIESLVKIVGRLFIIASTAVLYILNKTLGDPGARMKKLLSEIAQDRTPFHALNHFYSIIVHSAVQVEDEDVDTVDCYQVIVGTIVVIQMPLPVTTLARFLGVGCEKIYAMLRNLQSVVLLGGDDVPRIYHKSFPDFLTNPARCKDPRLQIDPRIRHTLIAIRCFEIMDKYLKYNILGLSNAARIMTNEDGLKEDGITDEQKEEKIPQQLRYACIYWVNHIEGANIEDPDLMNGLTQFADGQMLYWFEVMSLVGKLDTVHRSIRVVLKLLKSTSSDLYQLLSDGLRFISKFYDIIDRSALHTYHSALPFAPTNSLLHRRYIKGAGHQICSIEGGPEKWDAVIANLNHGKGVKSIKFSLDSTLFASCSEADTLAPLSANTAVTAVTALTLSRDSSRLACGFGDGTIQLWETAPTKRQIAFHHTHKKSTEALGFSPDGVLLASGSGDGTIKLWNGGDGSELATLEAPSGLRSVAVSNNILVVGANFQVTLWNLDTRSLIHSFEKSNDTAPRVSIADNNALIAIFYRFSGVSLVDAVNCTIIATFEVPYLIDKMTFLPDNSQLVVQSYDGALLSYNLINMHITKGPTLEHLLQVPNILLWHDAPAWHCRDQDRHYFSALFSQHKSPVPVIWIPRDLSVMSWTQRSSIIALGCKDGRVILIRLPTSY